MVNMMAKSYNKILKNYPEYITKEQFYQICNVSKKTALFYLENGLIPAIDSGKQTRRFKIATADVVVFLKKRDKNPERYRASPGWYRGNSGYKRKPPYALVPIDQSEKMGMFLERWLFDYPDLLKPEDVCKITGYSPKTTTAWCNSGKLHNFLIRRAFLIPKLSLIDFMMSDIFDGIKVKTDDYEIFLTDFQKL